MSSAEAMDSLEVPPAAPDLRAEQNSAAGARKGKQAAKQSPAKPHRHAGGTGGAGKKKKKNKKKNQPGKYSQLVIDVIRALGERGGSSLARVYAEARKVDWFDQEHGRTYLKYSVKALVQNDTLLQVKGTGANGSFKLNKNKLEKKAAEEKGKAAKPPSPTPKPAAKKSVEKAKPKAPKGKPEEKKKGSKEKSKKAKHSKKSLKTSVGKSVSKAMIKGKKSTKVPRTKRV